MMNDADQALIRNWRAQAACRDADPELFFPISTYGPALRQVDQAIAVCRTCPVRRQCLAWALEHGYNQGIWGGMAEDERRSIRVMAGRGS